MHVVNIHRRRFPVECRAGLGALLDGLAGPDDRLWPRRDWPPMRLDRPLAVGARGGHGPIRYVVEDHRPGRSVRFRFLSPAGFDGCHELVIADADERTVELRHALRMRARGRARLSWTLLYRPLHDALIEDAFGCAQRALGLPVQPAPWSRSVRLLRRLYGASTIPAAVAAPAAPPTHA